MREKIIYGGIHVGWRLYCKDHKHFIGYKWIDENYAYYEMFIAKRKLC